VFGNVRIDPEIKVVGDNQIKIDVRVWDTMTEAVIDEFQLESHEEYDALVREFEARSREQR
jgi:hypothetical protein